MFTPLPDDSGYDMTELNRDLDRAKTAAFLGNSGAFLGPLMCGMDFIWTNDVETAATDGIRVWWNPKDFLELSPELRKSTLLHELWHPANLHFVRRGDRDPQDWNIATDIDINNNLKADGYAVEKPYFIWDEQYTGWAVEDIYNAIHKPDQCAPRGGGGSDPGDPSSGSGQPTYGGTAGKDMVPNLNPQDAQRAINNVIQAAHSAVASGNPGAVPGSVQQVINKFLKPIVKWDVVLDRFLEELSQDDYSMSRPNRRNQEFYLPTLQGSDRLEHLIFYMDVSGSVTDAQALRFNSEVKHIKDKYNPEKLTMVQFDTRITSEITVTENDSFDSVTIIGRGGTCLIPVREHIMEHKPTAAIIFSDLYVEPMERGPQCPIIWIAISNQSAKVNMGQLIHIEG